MEERLFRQQLQVQQILEAGVEAVDKVLLLEMVELEAQV